MNTLSIEEIKKEITSQAFKHVGLFSTTDETIVPFNNGKVAVRTRMTEIERRLKSNALQDGIYIVKAKNSLGTKVKADSFYFAKGDVSLSDAPTTRIVHVQSKPGDDQSVISYQEALTMKTKIVEQALVIASLEKQIENLEYEIEELEESKLSDEAPSMFKGLSDMMPQIMPLVDKFFEQGDRKLAIEEKRLDLMKPRQAPPRPAPAPAAKQDPARRFIEAWDNSQRTAEEMELQDAVAQIYNDSENLSDFQSKLLELSPELHEKYLNFISNE